MDNYNNNRIGLYESLEHAQVSYLQLGQYVEAEKLLSRVNSAISNLGGSQAWNKTKEVIIRIQHKMYTRQLIETFGIGPKSNLYGFQNESKTNRSEKNEHPRIFAAVSEAGKMLVHVLYGVQLCSKDKTNLLHTPSNHGFTIHYNPHAVEYDIFNYDIIQCSKVYLAVN